MNYLKYEIGTSKERYEWEVKIRVKKEETTRIYLGQYNISNPTL